MNWTSKLGALAFATALGVETAPKADKELRDLLVEAHRAQIAMLRIDWGQPGFCTEWDKDFEQDTQACGKRGRRIQRSNAKVKTSR